ncbi:MAG: hypothetical protein WBA57_23505, partial [Elainellaceae cyanobacterium]
LPPPFEAELLHLDPPRKTVNSKDEIDAVSTDFEPYTLFLAETRFEKKVPTAILEKITCSFLKSICCLVFRKVLFSLACSFLPVADEAGEEGGGI